MSDPLPSLPSAFESVEELEEFLSRPTPEVVEAVGQLDGDILVLGAETPAPLASLTND